MAIPNCATCIDARCIAWRKNIVPQVGRRAHGCMLRDSLDDYADYNTVQRSSLKCRFVPAGTVYIIMFVRRPSYA